MLMRQDLRMGIVGLLWACPSLLLRLPKSPYEGGKKRRHFTLSDQAYNHLNGLANGAKLSRSETLERLIRCQALLEGEYTLSDDAWPEVHDFSSPDFSSIEP